MQVIIEEYGVSVAMLIIAGTVLECVAKLLILL